jgi:cytidylate kinase
LAAIDELGLLDLCPSPENCEAYRNAVAQIMHELAEEDNTVIVGRAGQVVLSGQPGTLHVQLIAPVTIRAERIAHKQHITMECALAQIETSDQYRINYMNGFYGVDWGNPDLYHIVINTGRMPPPQSASLIQQALSQLSHILHYKQNP